MRVPLGWFRFLLAAVAVATVLIAAPAAADTPYLTLARFDGAGPDLFLSFDHNTGNGQLFDQLRRPPSEMRGRRLEDNLFRTIGRPDQPAIVGEILLAPIYGSDNSVRDAVFVETSTGYVAFLDEFGKNGKLGTLITVLGRPFGPLAAADGNFALLPRRSDRTEGAYLFHGTTGKGLYLPGLAKLEVDAKVVPTADLPKLEGRMSAAEVLQGQSTVSYLMVDNTSGKAFFLDLQSGVPSRFNVRSTTFDLVAAFSAEKYNPSLQRFVLEPLDEGGTTAAVLVIDVSSGQIAIVDDPMGSPRLRMLPTNLYNVIRPGVQDSPRTFSTVRNGSAGVWVIDSLSATIYYLNSPLVPASTRVEPVSVSR